MSRQIRKPRDKLEACLVEPQLVSESGKSNSVALLVVPNVSTKSQHVIFDTNYYPCAISRRDYGRKLCSSEFSKRILVARL